MASDGIEGALGKLFSYLVKQLSRDLFDGTAALILPAGITRVQLQICRLPACYHAGSLSFGRHHVFSHHPHRNPQKCLGLMAG